MKAQYKTFAILLIAAIGLTSCSALKNMQQAIVNLKRCEFKLANVNDFRLMNVSLSNKASISDFSLVDAARLAAGFAKGDFPASFRLNVAARNPNDGTGGSKQASATMTSFAWTLIIDNTTTISGDIVDPVVIPGTGQEAIIPLDINLDLAEFFGNKGYESIANLALALGGVNGSPSRLTLKARPRIKTDFGTITYPGDITIVDKNFSAQ
jgi:hypothetical protein